MGYIENLTVFPHILLLTSWHITSKSLSRLVVVCPPIWKKYAKVKLDHFPQVGLKIQNIWNDHLDVGWIFDEQNMDKCPKQRILSLHIQI